MKTSQLQLCDEASLGLTNCDKGNRSSHGLLKTVYQEEDAPLERSYSLAEKVKAKMLHMSTISRALR
jgi:hypothetical protein